jgi:exosortase/archaeosortase family protein
VLLAIFAGLRWVLEWQAHDLHLVALNATTADVALAWLAAAGVSLVREGPLVMHAQGFVAEVHQTCTALLPAALLVAAIAMHRGARPGQKLAGMLLGVAFVAFVNQCRLVGVIWVGVHAPELFPAVHGWLAPAWLVALTAAYGLAWARTVRAAVSPGLRLVQR